MKSIGKNQTDPLVAILLVLFNEEQHIPRLIDSIINQVYENLVVFAIDNNSSDNSASLIESLMPNAFIFKSKINNGYAKGNNIIAEKAIKINPKYLFVLNTDMVLDANCIKELVCLSESYGSTIGAISPLILKSNDNNKTDIIQCYSLKANFRTGKTFSKYSNFTFKNIVLPDKIEVNTIQGGAAFINKELFDNVGLFNEDNFMYGDELDFAYRTRQTKYKMFVTKKAIAWHFHDWTKKNKTGYYSQYYYIMRNRFLFFHRYNKVCSLIVTLVKEMFIFLIKLRWALKIADIGLAKYYYLGILHGLQNRKGKANIECK